MITVLNRHHRPPPAGPDVRRFHIGRPTVLGNPFAIGRDGDREEVIRKYRAYIAEAKDADPQVAYVLRKIRAALAAGQAVELECWCAPQACHGDVLKELLEGEWR